MSQARETFLARVQSALHQTRRPGDHIDPPARGRIGYQGAGDPVARFRAELTAAGGQVYLCADGEAATEQVLALLQARPHSRIILGRGRVLDALPLAERLKGLECAIWRPGGEWRDTDRDQMFAADIAVSGVDYLIAETGSMVLFARDREPRGQSLLPPVHIAVAAADQILPDLFDLFGVLGNRPPSCVSIITGPSKTGDIELKLETGVHGPGEVHVVILVEH